MTTNVLRVGDIIHIPVFVGKALIMPAEEVYPWADKIVETEPVEHILVTAENIDALCKELGMERR